MTFKKKYSIVIIKKLRSLQVHKKILINRCSFFKKFGFNEDIKIIGLRYFNVYGIGEKYKGKSSSMIWQLHEQMKNGNHPRIFKYGEQKRDLVYIKDASFTRNSK